MTRRLLFLHGAGGFVEDATLADELGAALNTEVRYPRMPADDMSYESWARPVRIALSRTRADDVVVGHSFGASILLRVLAETPRPTPASVMLLAMPNWGPDGWDLAEYALTSPQPSIAASLHHCRDDMVVGADHLALNASLLPSARVHEYPSGGHQFDGLAEQIVAAGS
ncbi:alpha/beta hydrolase [Gordonia sp. L191]|uniref:alpha/beta fold hydrolase n=1 Tax=Gordonia sp. L191 TaxID=2982699 RepID=UPI0024C068FD|nr:alpha/beta hydrolase [Gordonia sp. L191]WHU47349.1 alpha/beta hydrolase [Gordonia sp. L191]